MGLNKFLYILFLGLTFLSSYSQSNFADTNYYIVDSLVLENLNEIDKHLLDSCLVEYHKTKSDTLKVNAINGIVEESWNSDLWIKYNDWIFKLCNQKLNEELTVDEVMFYKKHLAISYGNTGYFYKNQGQLDLSMTNYEKSLMKYEEIGDKEGAATILYSIGYVHGLKDENKKALEYYSLSLEVHTDLNNKSMMAMCYNNIGVIYDRQGSVEVAIEYYLKSLSIQEEIGDKYSIAIALNNLGYVNEAQKNYQTSLNYYYQALALQSEIGNETGQALVLNNIGFVNRELNRFDSAMIYYNQSLLLNEKINNKDGIAVSYNNLGGVLEAMGKLDQALSYFSQSVEIKTEIGERNGRASGLNNMARVHFIQGDQEKAKAYCIEAKSIALEIGYPIIIRNTSELLFKIYKKEQNYGLALANYELFISMNDSIINESNQKTILQQKFQYNYHKQLIADSVKNAEKEKIHIANIEEEQAKGKKQKLVVDSQKRQSLYLYFGLGLVLLFGAFIYNRYRVAQKQKEVINNQKTAVEKQKIKIEEQHSLLEDTHKEIGDSIKYAERLQLAILPDLVEFNKNFKSSFVLFKPKDVVSGDFYWMQKVGETVLFASADCTGHGVPGAMVSVVCSNALNRSVKEFNLLKPAEVLDKTRELVIETFAKSGKDIKDGMDIALCALQGSNLTYAGANNPLWIIRKTENLTEEQKNERSTVIGAEVSLIEYKANKQPIGLYSGMKNFEQINVRIFEEDTLYIFTDGFADQFGGQKGKKFKYRPFKQFLLDISNKEMHVQKDEITTTFNSWKKHIEQVDDVCIIGVKL